MQIILVVVQVAGRAKNSYLLTETSAILNSTLHKNTPRRWCVEKVHSYGTIYSVW